MTMNRPQFSLKSLLWLMVVVAASFGGMAVQKQLDKSPYILKVTRPSQNVAYAEAIPRAGWWWRWRGSEGDDHDYDND